VRAPAAFVIIATETIVAKVRWAGWARKLSLKRIRLREDGISEQSLAEGIGSAARASPLVPIDELE